jgi:hypothetical protein
MAGFFPVSRLPPLVAGALSRPQFAAQVANFWGSIPTFCRGSAWSLGRACSRSVFEGGDSYGVIPPRSMTRYDPAPQTCWKGNRKLWDFVLGLRIRRTAVYAQSPKSPPQASYNAPTPRQEVLTSVGAVPQALHKA